VTYVLDTNIVSYFLRGEGNVDNYFQQEIIETGNHYAIPFIVVYEIRRWLFDKPTRQLKVFSKEFNIVNWKD
jgi:predicted nucleic acid-binding protein